MAILFASPKLAEKMESMLKFVCGWFFIAKKWSQNYLQIQIFWFFENLWRWLNTQIEVKSLNPEIFVMDGK